jgi:glutathione S-transferase
VITLHGFARVPRVVAGVTRDMRVQWALEETGLPYRVHGLDQPGGELDSPDYRRISCFQQVPVIEDDGFVVAETGAVLLYLAEKSGKLIPSDFAGRTRVVQWCFAALNTVEWPLLQIALIDLSGGGEAGAGERRAKLVDWARLRFEQLERRLDGRQWIACADFTVADILLATVLRQVRGSGLIEDYPRLADYYARALARPAWQRTLELHAARLGVPLDEIR